MRPGLRERTSSSATAPVPSSLRCGEHEEGGVRVCPAPQVRVAHAEAQQVLGRPDRAAGRAQRHGRGERESAHSYHFSTQVQKKMLIFAVNVLAFKM